MSRWLRIKRFFLWLLPPRKVRIEPEVCPRCGTAGCLEFDLREMER